MNFKNPNDIHDRVNRKSKLWQRAITYQLDEYIKIVERLETILDSVIRIYNQEKYFLYWRVN